MTKPKKVKKKGNIKKIIIKNIVYFILFSIVILIGIIIFNSYSLETINIEPDKYLITFIVLLIGFVIFLSLNWVVRNMEIL